MEKEENFPERFSVYDYSLSGFFTEVAINLDNYATGQKEKLNEKDYTMITHASNILRDVSRNLRGDMNHWNNDNLIFILVS